MQTTEPVRVVAASGELDVYTAPKLRRALIEVTDVTDRLVTLDLSQVTFIDSTALGVIAGACKRLRSQGGDLRIVGVSPATRRVFAVSGLDRLLQIDGPEGLQG